MVITLRANPGKETKDGTTPVVKETQKNRTESAKHSNKHL